MLKAILSYSKKIPADGPYSSQSYHLSLETEIPDGQPQDRIQQKIHDTFELVKASVEQELQNGNGRKDVQSAAQSTGHDAQQGKATNRQLKYLTDLARERNISLTQLNEQVRDLYHVDSIYALSKADASKLVDSLRKDHKKAA
jgi:hypothetical protein